jgi:serine/threonine protein kinase
VTATQNSAATAELPKDSWTHLPAGVTVGEYEIEGIIGRGGMATVYAGRHPVIGKRVAIKVLDSALSDDARLVDRFREEACAVNRIGHPNIIDIFAFGALPDGRHYFVMEYLAGTTLSQRLARGPLGTGEARRLFMQVADALAAAHNERIVHRDLKPDNVWVSTPKRGESFAKLLDFGIAKLLDRPGLSAGTQDGLVMGTAHFMSPEQCLGEGVDHRTDIYAMGVMLYLAFAGRLPFEGETFAEVLGQQVTSIPAPPSTHRPIPAALEQLILSCLEKDPARRPQSAEALRASLAEALAPTVTRSLQPVPALPETRVLRKPRAVSRAVWPVGGALVVALAVLAAILLRPQPPVAAAPPAPAIKPRPAPTPPAPTPPAPKPLEPRAPDPEAALLRELRAQLRERAPSGAERERIEQRLLALQDKLGEIEVVCELEGSMVTVDGELVGLTPLAHPIVVRPGQHVLALTARGYRPLTRELTVAAGQRLYQSFQPAP